MHSRGSELSPEDKKRIYEEEKVRIEAQEQIRRKMNAAEKVTKELEDSKNLRIGCLTIIGIIIVLLSISYILFPESEGKDWSDVQYEVSIFYDVRQIEDSPDRKVWMGKVREESINLASLTATRLPNGKWKTELKHLNIPVR